MTDAPCGPRGSERREAASGVLVGGYRGLLWSCVLRVSTGALILRVSACGRFGLCSSRSLGGCRCVTTG